MSEPIRLDNLVAEPDRGPFAPPDQIPALLVQLASVQAILLSRLAVTPNGSQTPPPPEDDHYLTAEEAGISSGVRRDGSTVTPRRCPSSADG